MSGHKFRPELHALEAREVPALNLFYNGADLLLTGTPTAGATAFLQVQNTGENNFRVTDGTVNLGTYHVTNDIRVRLKSFDTNVSIDLGGGSLSGNVLVDVGAGDTDATTRATVSLVTNVENARVGGDVTFRGGSGQERFVILTVDEGETPLDIGGSVRVLGDRVTTPLEDSFTLGAGVEVHGDVTTSRITYTTISGTVNGDVNANALDSPGGMGFTLSRTGIVHGDVTATGGATALPLQDGTSFYSFAGVSGTVDGDVRYDLTSGRANTSVSGTVGGDVTVRAAGGPVFFTLFYGTIGGDLSYTATGDTSSSVSLYGDTAGGVVRGTVGGDVRVKGGGTGDTSLTLSGVVHGDVTADLGGPNSRVGDFSLDGRVDGSVRVTALGKFASAFLGNYGIFSAAPPVGGDLTIKFGNGTNSLTIDAIPLGDFPLATAVGGKLTYTGGSGVDTITITGKNMFAATIKTGAGNDAVAFGADATVGSAVIDFGAGTDTWTPPGVIAFPVKLKNLP